MPESLTRTLPGLPSSVREARGELPGFLPDATRLDDASLVLSELVTNAVLHSPAGGDGGEFEIRFQLDGGTLRIEVRHEGDAAAVMLPPADESFHPGEHPAFPFGESGRGLTLVDAIADKWGLDSAAGGGVLWWAELWTVESVDA